MYQFSEVVSIAGIWIDLSCYFDIYDIKKLRLTNKFIRSRAEESLPWWETRYSKELKLFKLSRCKILQHNIQEMKQLCTNFNSLSVLDVNRLFVFFWTHPTINSVIYVQRLDIIKNKNNDMMFAINVRITNTTIDAGEICGMPLELKKVIDHVDDDVFEYEEDAENCVYRGQLKYDKLLFQAIEAGHQASRNLLDLFEGLCFKLDYNKCTCREHVPTQKAQFVNHE